MCKSLKYRIYSMCLPLFILRSVQNCHVHLSGRNNTTFCWTSGAVVFNTINGIKRFGKLHKAKGLIQIVLTEVVIIGLMYGSQMLCILLTRKPVPHFLHKLNYVVIFHLILPHKIFYPVGNGKAFFQRPSGLMIPSLRQWKRKTQKNNLPP